MGLYPLVFEPVYLPKIWGSRALEKLGRKLPNSGPIGESWELADLTATRQEGAGGQSIRSVVARGPLAGRSLQQVLQEYGADLMGQLPVSSEGGFPLLIKLLSSDQSLSLQVHPSVEYARRFPGSHLKNEAWYILHAEPGTFLYKGLKPGVTADRVRSALREGSLEELLIRLPARAGECHYLPSGTCHAMGGGLTVVEIQTPSDTTFRLYDWGRTDRKLHVEEALACLGSAAAEPEQPRPAARIERSESVLETLVNCEHFRIEKIRYSSAGKIDLHPSNEPRVWMILAGAGRFDCAALPENESDFSAIQTLLIPAGIEPCEAKFAGPLTLLQITFPAAWGNLIA